jgi:tRNA-2-methylthio-N6-dimethylallyladenosine synthase
LSGRTPCDRIVVFQGNRRQIGQILPVRVFDMTPYTLVGDVVTQDSGPELYSLGVS